jgi:hypothetical protein
MIDLHILLFVPAEIPPWAGAALWALLGLTGHSLPQWLFVATLQNIWELRYISKRVLFETDPALREKTQLLLFYGHPVKDLGLKGFWDWFNEIRGMLKCSSAGPTRGGSTC